MPGKLDSNERTAFARRVFSLGSRTEMQMKITRHSRRSDADRTAAFTGAPWPVTRGIFKTRPGKVRHPAPTPRNAREENSTREEKEKKTGAGQLRNREKRNAPRAVHRGRGKLCPPRYLSYKSRIFTISFGNVDGPRRVDLLP